MNWTRQIDPKYHIEADMVAGVRIVKTSNGIEIPPDEPCILFRARDRHALAALFFYRNVCTLDGCTTYHMEGIDRVISQFLTFRQQQPDRMKQPGCTLGK